MKRRKWIIRSGAPTKGEKRYRKRKLHKKGPNYRGESSSVRVKRMVKVLGSHGWKFVYSIEATSPRGFRYTAQGDSSSEAFLKAFGQWRTDVVAIAGKAKQFIPKIKKSPVRLTETPRKTKETQQTSLSRIVKEAMNIPDLRKTKKCVVTGIPKVDNARTFRRLYMRAYRAVKAKESAAPAELSLCAA